MTIHPSSHVPGNTNNGPFGPGNISSTTIIRTNGKQESEDNTKKMLKTIFSKELTSKTKEYIENGVLGDRFDKFMFRYITTRKTVLHNLGEKVSGTPEDKTEKAMKRVKKFLQAYYEGGSDDTAFKAAMHDLPKRISHNKHAWTLFGTLCKNLPSLMSYYNGLKEIKPNTTQSVQQLTFPGWQAVTRDGKEPVIYSTDNGETDDYMIVRTNVQPGKMQEARKYMKDQGKDMYAE